MYMMYTANLHRLTTLNVIYTLPFHFIGVEYVFLAEVYLSMHNIYIFVFSAMMYLYLIVLFVFCICSGSGSRDKDHSIQSSIDQDQCEIAHENPVLSDVEINLAFQLSMLSALSYADWSLERLGMRNTVEFEMHKEDKGHMGALLSLVKRTSCQISTSVGEIFKPNVNYWHAFKSKNLQPPTPFNSTNRGLPQAFYSSHPPCCAPINASKASCPPASFSRQTFQHLWFFNGWSEKGVWHDTEVLVSTHAGALVIVFRGSESVADLVTSSQFLEPARYSRYFRNISHGSVHRGIFNAYHKVDRGEIVLLTNRTASTSGQDNEEVDSSIRDAYRNCLQSKNTSYDNNASQLLAGVSCPVSDLPLSSLLVQTASKALRAGRQVYLTGHSLGGALASFMALDLLINANESRAFLKEKSEVPMYDDAMDSDDFDISEAILAQTKEASNVKNNDPFFKNIHLHTFGEPEIADNHFFHDLLSSYSHISHFVMDR
jgi:hypothetical protein